jgi:hypothetical protein
MRIGERPRDEHVSTAAGSIPMISSEAWSSSYLVIGGALSRSAATCVNGSLRIRQCGYATKASIKLSTRRIRVS